MNQICLKKEAAARSELYFAVAGVIDGEAVMAVAVVVVAAAVVEWHDFQFRVLNEEFLLRTFLSFSDGSAQAP